MARRWLNFVEGTLDAGITASATSLSLTLASNSQAPAASAASPLFLVLDPEGAEHEPEIVKCTAVSGSGPYTLTVVRGQEGTQAEAFDEDRKVVAAVTATAMDELAVLADAETVTGAWTFSANVALGSGVTVDGRDPSSDGTKLDGIESGATADQSAAEIRDALKTVDGAGSGVDADLLDGQHGSYYSPTTHTHSYLPLTGGTLTGDLLLSGNTTSKIDNATGTGREYLSIRADSAGVSGGAGINLYGDGDNEHPDKIIFYANGDDTASMTLDDLDTTVAGDLTVSGGDIVLGNNVAQISSLGSNELKLRADQVDITNKANSELMIQCDANGAVTLYYDNTARVATLTDGAHVSGNLLLTDASPSVIYDDTDNNYHYKHWHSGGYFYFQYSGDSGANWYTNAKLTGSSEFWTVTHVTSGNMYPATNNTYDCGVSVIGGYLAWDDVHAYGYPSISDGTMKTVSEPAPGLDFLKHLNPVSFSWTDGTRQHWGFTAQEVRDAIEAAGMDPSDTGVWCDASVKAKAVAGEDADVEDLPQYALRYDEFIAPLVRAVTELAERVEALEAA